MCSWVRLLQALRSRVPEGQQMLDLLLQETSADDEGLEELRYHWQVYKTQLKDARIRTSTRTAAKVREPL